MKKALRLGVVVGRFQVPVLHAGHEHLLTYTHTRNDDMLVVIGSHRGFPTIRNPLPFSLRESLVREKFPQATVIELLDHNNDETWSAALDHVIQEHFPHHMVTLYGSRDSFIPHYTGAFVTQLIPTCTAQSGTEVRHTLTRDCTHTPDFRRGVMYRELTRNPLPYPAVDIALVREDTKEVLLGQKHTDGDKWRFIGGFFDPEVDTSHEAAACRELKEETGGLDAGELTYLGSTVIDDWRYRDTPDCIITTFFRARYTGGVPQATDDIARLAWVRLEDCAAQIVPSHAPLMSKLLASFATLSN